MVIRSDKSIHLLYGTFLISMIIIVVLTWYVFGWIVAIMLNTVPIYFILRMWFFQGRTLVMDSKGCIMHFGKFKIAYNWDELKYKSIERWNLDGSLYPAIERGVIFSKRKSINHGNNSPGNYAFYSPFDMSLFYVYFSIGKPRIRSSRYGDITVPEVYCVDEDEFMAKMHEWNVKIDVCMEEKSVNTYSIKHTFTPDLFEAEQKADESMKRYVQEENQTLKNSIQGYNKCRVYKIQEMLKYNHEIGIIVYDNEVSLAVRCVYEKNSKSEVVKTFYIENQKYEYLEDIGAILENYCNEEGFLTVGLVDPSLSDCQVRWRDKK